MIKRVFKILKIVVRCIENNFNLGSRSFSSQGPLNSKNWFKTKRFGVHIYHENHVKVDNKFSEF